MITKEPWFGPKTGIGWGWTPITWQGWAITILSLVIIIGGPLAFGRAYQVYFIVGGVVFILAACLLTGTKPG